MRHIGLRAWDETNKVMGYLDHPFDNNWYTAPSIYGTEEVAFTNSWKDKDSRLYVIMTPTRLVDMNYEAIYENDVCSCWYSDAETDQYFKSEVTYYGSGFCVCDPKGQYIELDCLQKVKILGNRWENPELIN
jgi:hypothetical protein